MNLNYRQREPDERNQGLSKTESVLAFVAALLAAFLARELLEAGWRRTLDRDPPKNPSSHDVAWREALTWGASSGALVGIARIAFRHFSTGAYRRWRA